MNPPTVARPPAAASAPGPRKIALVEDKEEIRNSLIRLLATFPGFRCVCACASGEDALKEIPQAQPDVVLMDIFLPRMSGIECTARLKGLMPNALILILTASDDEDMVFPALEAGADGYLLKQAEPTRLRAALLELLNGGVPMTSSIARRVMTYFRNKARSRDHLVRLTAREKDLLFMLSKGYANKEIADKLGLSIDTIHSYLKNVYKKMHVHSRAEAVAKYMSSQSS